jgi:hypothetical protein
MFTLKINMFKRDTLMHYCYLYRHWEREWCPLEDTYCFTCPPISIAGTIYRPTPEFQIEWKKRGREQDHV